MLAGRVRDHAVALVGVAVIVALFVGVEELHAHNPSFLLLVPILFITLRQGTVAGLAYWVGTSALDAYWLYTYGAAPGAWGELDAYRLVFFTLVTPALVVLAGTVRRQASELAVRRAAERQLELERDLDRARARLAEQETLATIGAVVNGLSHEMRTPLAAISNDLHLAQARLHELPPATRAVAAQAIADALASVERLARTVERLRPYASQARRRERIRFEETIEDAARLLRVSLPHGHRVRCELAPAGQVRADPLALQQVLLELLKNALEASPPDRPVRVATARRGDRAELSVSDEGPGIAPEHRGHVFSEFFTTRPGARGLGLSIVRRHVEAHGGAIELETGAFGTTVRILLPLDEAPREVPVLADAAPAASAPAR